jgi:hypothetical protein
MKLKKINELMNEVKIVLPIIIDNIKFISFLKDYMKYGK